MFIATIETDHDMKYVHIATLTSTVLFLPAIFYFLFTALGITAGAHRLWSHHSYKAKTPLRILLALMNSAALQVSRSLTGLW